MAGLRVTLMAALLGLVVAGCTSAPGAREGSRVAGEGGVILTITSTAVNHPPTTITVTIDDALVASQLLGELAQGPKSFHLKIPAGHHKLTARANTGRTKQVFPIFIHEDIEKLALTYICDCKKGDHVAARGHFSLDQPQSPAEAAPLQQ